MRDDVLIVGAGPTGLVLALWLTKLGVRVRIIDMTAAPGTTSRAMLVQARTLELYQQLNLANAVIDQGHKVDAVNVWADGEHKARIPMGPLGKGLTPYPFLQVFPQDLHERLLVDRLEAMGVRIERQTEMLDFADRNTHVRARVRKSQGNEEVYEAFYIVGCDGGRSLVRKTIGAEFPGGTYRQVFYVADIVASGPAMNGEAHVDLQREGFLMVFGIDGAKRARLVGIIDDDRAERAETLTFEDVSSEPIRSLKLNIEKVNWFSTYRVHHRIAHHFRRNRAFIAGDAGHVHSPAGGQGMNTGIGDSINLAWKLAAVLRNQARDDLLDSYEAERLPFARKLVETTDRMFTFATAQGHFAEIVRTRLAPILMPVASHLPAVPEFMFRTVSQIMLQYRESPLGDGKAGHVHGGDRLPWVDVKGSDNFDSLIAIKWQVHVYGAAEESLKQWCWSRHIPLQVFEWIKEYGESGLEHNAAYLLRPDTYVACAVSGGKSEVLDKYMIERGISQAG